MSQAKKTTGSASELLGGIPGLPECTGRDTATKTSEGSSSADANKTAEPQTDPSPPKKVRLTSKTTQPDPAGMHPELLYQDKKRYIEERTVRKQLLTSPQEMSGTACRPLR